jgi:hypothetical protein
MGMRCFLAVLGLSLALGCTRSPTPAEPTPSLRLAVVTDLKGYLEPCGCTSNPLGGIDRLAAEVNALRQDGVPVVLLAAGDLFFDSARIEATRVDQAHRNAKTLATILDRIGLAAALPGASDLAQPAEILDELRANTELAWLADESPIESVQHRAGAFQLALLGVRAGADPDAVAAAGATASAEADLSIVLVDGSRREANRFAAPSRADFVIQGGLDQDAPIAPRPSRGAWVFHASRQGQGLTVVDLFVGEQGAVFVDQSDWSREERMAQLDRRIDDLAAKIDAWESSAEFEPEELEPQREQLAGLRKARSAAATIKPPSKGNAFDARFVELPTQSPRDPAVSRLMREHDKAVNQANRAAFANLKPPALGPDDIAYVGSAACSGCHAGAYTWWRNHSHGTAYLTLQQRHKEFNLDCVGCHVTGYEQPGGSTVTHNLDMALVGVGCESCHGPGAAHVANPEVEVVRMTPESTCVACHNEEHSDLFDYEAYLKTLVVPGHGLPIKTDGSAATP